MKRAAILLSVAVAALVAAPLVAAPRAGDKNDGPAIVGQAKSFADLLKLTKDMVRTIGGEAMYKSFEQDALPKIDPKNFPGIDPKKPFGMYGTLDPEIAKSRAVFLIPITTQKDFLDMLEVQGIKAEKGEGEGIFNVSIPLPIPIPIALKIHKGYAYVAIGGAEVLAGKGLIDPQDIINDKEKSAVYVGLHLDRIPKETKQFILAFTHEEITQAKDNAPAEELKGVIAPLEKLYMRWLKSLFDEGRELAVRLDADAKTGNMAVEISVDGVAKSKLAEAFAKRQPTKNAFASLVGDDYVTRMYLTAPLFADEVKEALAKLVEWGGKEAVTATQRNSPAEGIALIESTFKSLKATVESGEMDMAFALRGPNKDSFYSAVAAMHLKETAQLEKAVREAVKIMPEKQKGWFKFDATKIGDIAVHEIDLSDETNEIVEKLFGKEKKVYFAFGPSAIYASYGSDGMKLLKEAIAAKPELAPSYEAATDEKKAKALIAKIAPKNDPRGRIFARLGISEAAIGAATLKIEGGDKLKIRFSYDLRILGGVFGSWASRTGADAPPPPCP